MENPEPLDSDDFPLLLGKTYARWTLDGLIEIGYAVSVDFIIRPTLFVSSDIPGDDIVALRMSYGNFEDLPNTAQRLAMMMPILGKSDGLKPDASGTATTFYTGRKRFLDACIAFSERAVDTGVIMLENAVRTATDDFRKSLVGFIGTSARQSAKQIGIIFALVTRILTSAGVATVYGVPPADKDWPLLSNDPNGAKLVQAAGMVLPVAADYKLSYTKFLLLQRVAQEGMRTLPQVLTVDINNENDLKSLISNGYTWATSLRDFQQAP
jgi:hypothetical protein